jgi:prolyl-tRNA editing enzyme YbaK/EbsC (Cys-tRNA(Pro) deacylase)
VAELPASARRVADALAAAGVTTTIVVLEHPARTSADAARAVGCAVGQIVKSLVFRLGESGRPLLVLTSGAHRVDETKLGALLGERLGKADAEFVRAHTGFAIGGVAPLAHPAPLTTLVDEDLLAWDAIWAAGGHPHTVFRLTPAELLRVTGGRVVAVRAAAEGEASL